MHGRWMPFKLSRNSPRRFNKKPIQSKKPCLCENAANVSGRSGRTGEDTVVAEGIFILPRWAREKQASGDDAPTAFE